MDHFSANFSYFLGWVITDGCVQTTPRNVISWDLADEEPLLIIKRIVGSDKKIEKTKRGYYRLRLCGREIVESVMAHGITPRKTFTTQLPNIPDEYMSHFMRGVIDGDGTITLRKGGSTNREGYLRLTVDIASGNKDFPKGIINYLGYGRFVPNYGTPGHESFRVSFDCLQAVKLLNWVYKDSEGLRLTRKWDKWQAFLNSGQTYKQRQVC